MVFRVGKEYSSYFPVLHVHRVYRKGDLQKTKQYIEIRKDRKLLSNPSGQRGTKMPKILRCFDNQYVCFQIPVLYGKMEVAIPSRGIRPDLTANSGNW